MNKLLLPILVFSLSSAVAKAQLQPNVVIILTDDQGWGDLSVNGNTNLNTPNIDKLSAQGATMNQFFVCQVCAPTRAEFLTGRYYPRTGVSGVSRGQERLNPDETTIADVFKQAGYRTGAFGKWHNGTQPPFHPNTRGFDEFYGFTSGHWGHYFSPPLDHNGQKVRGNGYVVDDFTDHALRFIEDNRNQPFFCYIPYNTPHSPMMVDDRFYEKFDGKELTMRHRDPEREDIQWTRAALAMCENIDWNVGRILHKLDDLKLTRNTIVIFFSDNGPNSYRWNGGFKGRKGSIDEGGVRSPFFIRWPDKIEPGIKFDQVAAAIDLLPTLSRLAGIEHSSEKPLDGINLESLLLGRENHTADRMLFSTKPRAQEADVSVRTQMFRMDENGQLFNMVTDPGQRKNISLEHPEITRNLITAKEKHASEMAGYFEQNANRPFTVGYAKTTQLPARDGEPHGSIERSVRSPNNSFFTNWSGTDGNITWDIEVMNEGMYSAIVYYTCAKGDQGCTIRLESDNNQSAEATVADFWDPPLYDKSRERVENSHYFMKDFKPLRIGTIYLREGPAKLLLGAVTIKGEKIIDVSGIELVKIN